MKENMIEIENIQDEYNKKSTGCFKDRDGDVFYLLNGKLHREDGAAIEYSDGSKVWSLYGKYHRVDGPALEWSDSDKYWYLHGERAKSKKQFYNPEWRRAVEIKLFL